jgi:hypothetical protein
MGGRSRDRIMKNLESVFRDAYERAKGIDDPVRMADLDSSYQREQLLLEVLLDIREGLEVSSEKPSVEGAMDKINMLRKIVKPR